MVIYSAAYCNKLFDANNPTLIKRWFLILDCFLPTWILYTCACFQIDLHSIILLFFSSRLSITVCLDNIQPLRYINSHVLHQWSCRYSQCLFTPLFSCFTTVLTHGVLTYWIARTVTSIRLWLQKTEIHHMVNGGFDEVIYIRKCSYIPMCTSMHCLKLEHKHLQ